MSEPRQPLRDSLIVALVQTLILGARLAILGYFLNVRLELYKQSLGEQTEKTKAALAAQTETTKSLLAALEPLVQARRSAYLDVRQAAREAKNELEIYYFRSKGRPDLERREQELHELAHKMGVGSGGATSSWRTNEDALAVVRKLVSLREKYQDVASDKVNSAIDDFIDTLTQDLRAGTSKSNDTDLFHEAARKRLCDAFARLDPHLKEALRLAELPIQ
jgi:hypothetical protein